MQFDEQVCRFRTDRFNERQAAASSLAEHEFDLSAARSSVRVTTNAGAYSTPVVGEVDFSFCRDGADAECPFRIASAAADATQNLAVDFLVGGAIVTKIVSNLSISTVQPGVGVALGGGTNDVQIPKGGLSLRTEFDLDGNHYAMVRPNEDKIAADVAEDGLSAVLPVTVTFPLNGEQMLASISVTVTTGAKQASPPVIRIDIPSTVSCTQPTTLSASISDPDGDLQSTRWLVDGQPLAGGTTAITLGGPRTLEVVATDARGAASSARQAVACLP